MTVEEATKVMVKHLAATQEQYERRAKDCAAAIRALQAECKHRWGGNYSGSHATYHECEICGKSEEC